MAELINTTIEDDDSDDSENKNKPRLDPKKLANVPFLKPPETVEKRATAEDLKRTVPFIPPPPMFEETRAKVSPESEVSAEDDDDEEEGEEPTEAVAFEEAAPPSTAEMYELAEEEMAHLREEGTPPAPETPQVAETAPDQADVAEEEPSAATGGGTAAPPPPPPPSESSFFGRSENSPLPPQPVPTYKPSFEAPLESHPTPAYTAPERPAVEMSDLKRTTEEERRRNLRLVVIAGVATGLLLKAYIDAKTKGYKEMLEPLKDMAVDMLTGQKRTDARVEKVEQKVEKAAAPIPAESLPPIQQPQEQIFDMEGNPITLQPGWHVERATGGYSVVLDRHNRVIYDAIQYGEAFKRDQKREQVSPDLFAPVATGVSAGAPADDFVAGLPAPDNHVPDLTPESTLPEEYRHPVEDQKDSSAPRNNLLWGLSVPWILTAVAILLIIYFIAALA
jgi:hypothetical protein